MTCQVFDCELWLPGSLEPKPDHGQFAGPPGPHRLPSPPGYGMANYDTVFRKYASVREPAGGIASQMLPTTPEISLDVYRDRSDELMAMMDDAGVVAGLLATAPNDVIADLCQRHNGRLLGMISLSPYDGMRAVRELERAVRDDGIVGLHIFGLYDQLPASDRRYYPLYAKCAELDVPVRVYTAMTFANDRPYDLGHPRHLDQVAVDFPELRILAGLGGWPWVNEIVALVRRHPNLYLDTGSHRPKYLSKPGAGWEMLMSYGSTVLQDKIMVGLSWVGFGIPLHAVVEEYANLGLPEEVLAHWLYDNAATFFKLPTRRT